MIIIEYVSPDGEILETREIEDHLTINQAASTICPDSEGKFPVPTIALVGAKPAVKELGDWDFPLSDTKIQFRQLAMGGGGGGIFGGGGGDGGSNPLQLVMQVAVIALAAVTTYLTVGTLGPVWAGALGSLVMLGGSLLVGALFPNNMAMPSLSIPQGQAAAYNAEQASPTYNINASGNQARLYQTEPELFGRMKIVPDFVANTWTEFIDNDQIGYFVYGIGRGHYDVESMQFGETVFWRNGSVIPDAGYDIQKIQIVEPGGTVSIFPDNMIVSDEVSGQQLFAPNSEEYEGRVGPYTTNPPGTVTNYLSFDFVFQQGVGHYKDDGSLEEFFIQWHIYYRKIDDFGNPISVWYDLDHPTIEMATTTPQRVTKSYWLDEARYEVSCERFSWAEGDGRTLDTLLWSGLRAMLPGTYTYPITCVAFSVKANNALTQAASRQFSLIASRKLPVYNRSTRTWSAEQKTRSWAAAVSHVCKCEWGGRLSDADFDLDTLWAIDEKLQSKGWYYDSYIDGPYLVWTLLCEMCQSQCVIPRFIGPILSFVQDTPDRKPSFALTPRNIMRNSFSVDYVTWSDSTPDDVTIDYLDAEYAFQQRDVTAVLPESESQEPANLTILGITDRKHAFDVAVAYAAHNRWQRVKVSCQVEAMGRIINVGDVCTVAHPRFQNTCAGAIKSWDESKLLICIYADIPLPFDKYDGYYFERTKQTEYPKTLDKISLLGIRTDNTNRVNFLDTKYFYTINDVESKARLTHVADDRYIAFTRSDGSIWGPCKIDNYSEDHITLNASDYATLLLQGQGNPFEFFTWGKNSQPTTWTLYTARKYQRLMVVNSIKAQDNLHYSLELLNYTNEIYKYTNLPVPVWGGRGQLPSDTFLRAPMYLKGRLESTTRINLAWLSVPGATWYEVQVSSTESNWNKLGRISETRIATNVSAGIVRARVRAGNEIVTSAWTYWTGNTLLAPPSAPNPRLSGKYDGNGKIVWNAVPGATWYAINISSGSNKFYVATISSNEFQITPEIQTGGPYRNLTFSVSACNENGASSQSAVNLSYPAPEKITDANFTPAATMLTLNSVTPALENITGYAIARGTIPNFQINQVLELTQTSQLPYTLYNLGTGTVYIRIAAKDAFYDAYHDPFQLNWSDVFIEDIP